MFAAFVGGDLFESYGVVKLVGSGWVGFEGEWKRG